jgi:hypothetical protein
MGMSGDYQLAIECGYNDSNRSSILVEDKISMTITIRNSIKIWLIMAVNESNFDKIDNFKDRLVRFDKMNFPC